MHTRRGQAAVEAIAISLIVLALVLALAAGGGFAWLSGLVTRAFDDRAAPRVSPASLAYLDRAVADADGAGPPLRDALLRVAQDVGLRRARGLAAERLLRRYAVAAGGRTEALADPSWALADPHFDGLGPPRPGIWSDETPRAPSTVRIVDRAAERAWWDRRRPSLPARAVDLGTTAIVGAATAVAPALTVPAALLEATAASLGPSATGIPAGSREGDAVICRFVWRRNAAEIGWAPAHAGRALRLELGRRLPAVELIVVRAGRIEGHAMVRSDATAC